MTLTLPVMHPSRAESGAGRVAALTAMAFGALALTCLGTLTLAAPPVPLGDNFQIGSDTGPDALGGRPAIAFDGTNFFVVWRESSGAILGARVSADGVPLDGAGIVLGSGTGTPSTAFGGSDFLTVWSNGEIYGSRVTPAGVLLDESPIQITTSGNSVKVRPISLAFDGTNYLIAWRTILDQIFVARVSTAGVIVDGPAGFQIGQGFYPWVAFDGTNYMVIWHGHGNGLDIFGNRIATDGTILDGTGFAISSAEEDQDHASVAFGSGGYFVAWHDTRGGDAGIYNDGSARGTRVSVGGVVLDNPAIEIAEPVRGPGPVNVTFDGEDFFVVWQEDLSPAKHRAVDVYGRRVSPAGVLLDAQGVPISTAFFHQWGPRTGFGGDRHFVAWSEGGRCEFITYSNQACVWGQVLSTNTPSKPASVEPSSPASVARGPVDWTVESSPTNQPLYAVWATSDTDVYAVGEETSLFHFDGTAWNTLATGLGQRMFGLWAAPDDVWAVGWCGYLNHYDGASVTNSPDCHGDTAFEVWAADPSDILTVAPLGGSFRYNGLAGLGGIPTGVSVGLWDIWGTGPSEVYAVGAFGTVLQYTGTDWASMAGIPTVQSLNAIWGTTTDDLWVVGDFGTILHFDGATWEQQPSGTTQHLLGVWGADDGSIYAVGTAGTILRRFEGAWLPENSGTELTLLGVSRGGSTMWAVGDGGLILRKKALIFADGFESG
ncbi:MAG: hypothetical protein IH936_13625 [Acidobacteria bacterium]|nr:hypothetical protein [Acidobacteriota bacterium]